VPISKVNFWQLQEDATGWGVGKTNPFAIISSITSPGWIGSLFPTHVLMQALSLVRQYHFFPPSHPGYSLPNHGLLLQQEFEEVLPYHALAVRLPQHAIYRLPQLLESLMKEPTKVIPKHKLAL